MKLPNHLSRLIVPFIGAELMLLVLSFADGWIGDMAKNLSTEVLAAVVLLFFVDQWIKKHEQERLQPAKRAMFNEAVTIERELTSLLNSVALATLDNSDAQLVNDVRAGDLRRLASVLTRLDWTQSTESKRISKSGAIYQPSWANRIGDNLRSISAHIDKFMARYVAIAPPEMTEAVQSIERTALFTIARMPNITERLPLMPQIGWEDVLDNLATLNSAIDDARSELGVQNEKRLRSWRLLDQANDEEIAKRLGVTTPMPAKDARSPA